MDISLTTRARVIDFFQLKKMKSKYILIFSYVDILSQL